MSVVLCREVVRFSELHVHVHLLFCTCLGSPYFGGDTMCCPYALSFIGGSTLLVIYSIHKSNNMSKRVHSNVFVVIEFTVQ